MNSKNTSELYLVDVQRHFEKGSNFDNSHDFKNIVSNLKKNFKKYHKITLIVDEWFIEETSHEELMHEYEMEYADMFESYDEFYEFADRNSHLIEKNVDFELMRTLDTLKTNNEIPYVNTIEKNYGDLRGMMDYHIDKMVYIIELKKRLGYRELEEGMEEDEGVKRLVGHLKEDEGLEHEEIEELLENGEFDSAEYAGREYYTEIGNRERITMAGGGAMECLLEEYIHISLNNSVKEIEIDMELVYGEKIPLANAAETIKDQIDTIQSLNNAENKSKKQPRTR